MKKARERAESVTQSFSSSHELLSQEHPHAPTRGPGEHDAGAGVGELCAARLHFAVPDGPGVRARPHFRGNPPSHCILIHAARSPDLPGLLRTDAAWYSELTQPDAGTIDMHWQQIYPQLSKRCR
jgi:hypothetical protein